MREPRDAGERGPAGASVEREAFAKVLDLLARRPHFRAELARKLGERGFAPEAVDEALARAAALGYLESDERLAARFAEELARRKGLGRAGIARELARRGATESAIATALSGFDEADELERARALAARRAGAGAEAAALARHLERKGFSRSVIFRVSREFARNTEELEANDE